MRFLLLLLSLVLQLNVSGFANHNPQENHAIKTLTSETLDCGGRSYELFRYYDPSSGNYLSQDPIGLAGTTQLCTLMSITHKKLGTTTTGEAKRVEAKIVRRLRNQGNMLPLNKERDKRYTSCKKK